jgi:hypothetical protein
MDSCCFAVAVARLRIKYEASGAPALHFGTWNLNYIKSGFIFLNFTWFQNITGTAYAYSKDASASYMSEE